MKKIALATISAALLLSACGTKTVVVEVEATTTTTEYVAPEPQYGTENYISNVISLYPGLLNSMGRPKLIEFADLICQEIDNGLSFNGLAQMGIRSQIDLEMLGFLTGEAIRNFCPHNQWFIDSALNA